LHGTDRSDITGSRFIQLDITALVASGATALSVSVFRSSSGNATWNLWGSDVFGVKGRQLGPSATINHPATFSLLEVPNFRNFDFISVGSGGGGVLLADLEVTAPTPPAPIPATEPSSAGLLLIGLGALVAAGILGKKLLA
jgi:hypothetical protein